MRTLILFLARLGLELHPDGRHLISAAPGDIGESEDYTIKVWETTSGTTSSLGTYSTLQGVADAGVEGVTITVNLGSVVPDEFDIVITKD